MKHKLVISFVLTILLCSSCDTYVADTYDKFDFFIDSIYNVTSNSATVKATLTVHNYGTVNVSGLYVVLDRSLDSLVDSLHREIDFDKKEGVVRLVLTDLKPNTVYYIMPMARFDPPFRNKWVGRITGMGSPNSQISFATLALDSVR